MAPDADPDFQRLERAVVALVERQRSAAHEILRLREAIAERDLRIRELDGQVFELNQGRQDIAKRIDDLVAQISQLEIELDSSTR